MSFGELEIMIRRGRQEFGPLTAGELAEGLQNGTVIETDVAWFEGLGDWKPAREAQAAALRARPTSRMVQKVPQLELEPATDSQKARLQSLGLPPFELQQLTREKADYLMDKAERSLPATHEQLEKLKANRIESPPDATIATARILLDNLERKPFLERLTELGIPFNNEITAAEARDLISFGPATAIQRNRADELGVKITLNMSTQAADYILVRAEKREQKLVDAWHPWVCSLNRLKSVTVDQVRNVIRYLNGNHPQWLNDDPAKRFLFYLEKFYPYLSN